MLPLRLVKWILFWRFSLDLKSLIRDVPDYPTKGVLFRDLTPLMANPSAMLQVTDTLAEHLRVMKTAAIAAIDWTSTSVSGSEGSAEIA